MLEGQHRTADQRLAELVAEVGSTIRGFDQYLLGRLVEPLANGQDVFPVAGDDRLLGSGILLQPRIGSHIDGCAGNGP